MVKGAQLHVGRVGRVLGWGLDKSGSGSERQMQNSRAWRPCTVSSQNQAPLRNDALCRLVFGVLAHVRDPPVSHMSTSAAHR